MNKRFSKSALIEELIERADALKDAHNFDEHDGWNQVKQKDIDVIVNYGRFRELCDLIDELSA